MKKKKRNFIIKICSLLLLGIISVTLLSSWTYDPTNETITSQNLWDEQWEVGALNEYGLLDVNLINRRTSSYISILPEHYYSYSVACQGGRYAFYDNNKNLILYSIDGFSAPPTFSPSNAYFLRITFATTYGTTYRHDIMINEGQTLLPYEPYGTYVNQQKLDDLELDYDDLAEQYSNLYDDYQELNSLYQQLQQDYDTLNDNYGVLEYNYGHLQSELDSLQYDYNELNYNYEQLQQQYDDLENTIKPYVFDYSQFQINLGNATQTGDNFVATQSVSNISNYFDEFGGFDLDALYNNYSGFGSSYTSIEFIVPTLNLVYYNAMFSFSGMPDMNYRIYLTNSKGQNTSFSYDIKDIVFDNQQTNLNFTLLGGIIHSNSDSINEFVLPLQFTNYTRLILTGLNVGALNVHKISFVSNNSYNVGFQDGYNSISSLYNNSLDYYRNLISEKDASIKLLNAQITDLNNQILNSVGWKPLFFAIADTPFKVVSNILGFELFGVNLFNAFVGIITALAMIWLIKKLLGK